jgi:hypothetical protein
MCSACWIHRRQWAKLRDWDPHSEVLSRGRGTATRRIFGTGAQLSSEQLDLRQCNGAREVGGRGELVPSPRPPRPFNESHVLVGESREVAEPSDGRNAVAGTRDMLSHTMATDPCARALSLLTSRLQQMFWSQSDFLDKSVRALRRAGFPSLPVPGGPVGLRLHLEYSATCVFGWTR